MCNYCDVHELELIFNCFRLLFYSTQLPFFAVIELIEEFLRAKQKEK